MKLHLDWYWVRAPPPRLTNIDEYFAHQWSHSKSKAKVPIKKQHFVKNSQVTGSYKHWKPFGNCVPPPSPPHRTYLSSLVQFAAVQSPKALTNHFHFLGRGAGCWLNWLKPGATGSVPVSGVHRHVSNSTAGHNTAPRTSSINPLESSLTSWVSIYNVWREKTATQTLQSLLEWSGQQRVGSIFNLAVKNGNKLVNPEQHLSREPRRGSGKKQEQ